LPAIAHATLPLSSSEVDYPALRQMVEASKLGTPADVRAWRARATDAQHPGGRDVGAVDAPTSSMKLPAARAASGRPLSDTIQRRGSTRQFSHDAIDAAELATALWAATRPLPADVPLGIVTTFLIVNAVDGVPPGAYVYRANDHALERIHAGAFRERAAYLTLEQTLGGDAAATLFFLAPLDALRARWGERAYRLANLDAGIAGGRAYLAAYAQGFGASGLTFYDQHVVEFFASASNGLDAIFVTALGRSVRQPRASVVDRLSRRTA
jgi:SagB-type dehydrogenase family enzyme